MPVIPASCSLHRAHGKRVLSPASECGELFDKLMEPWPKGCHRNGERIMKISPSAGKPAEASMLVNVPRLVTAYYTEAPDPSVPEQRVAFGTSGHRGSAFDKAFNEWHILAISSGHLPVPKAAKDRWPAVSRHGHACPFRAGSCQRAGGAGGKRGGSHDRGGGRIYSDPCRFPRDSHLQPRAQDRTCRRHRHHAVAQSAA